jgi:hypothetical protein
MLQLAFTHAARAPALALAVVEAADDAAALARVGRLVQVAALARLERVDEARAIAQPLVEAWLEPAKVGALNQYVGRNELLEALHALGESGSVLRARVEAAPPVEIALPEGDTI